MPRNPSNRTEFIAGMLPTIMFKNPNTGLVNSYFIDGRLQELRNVNDFMDKITCIEDDVWDSLSVADRNKIVYEFYGETIN